jgi:hypothetical protein
MKQVRSFGTKEGPRRYRYTFEVCPPDTMFEQRWVDDLMKAVFDAVYAKGGVLFCGEDENELIKVKEIRATREN